jgi:hypothetical protein
LIMYTVWKLSPNNCVAIISAIPAMQVLRCKRNHQRNQRTPDQDEDQRPPQPETTHHRRRQERPQEAARSTGGNGHNPGPPGSSRPREWQTEYTR